jgi:hypothetical protein
MILSSIISERLIIPMINHRRIIAGIQKGNNIQRIKLLDGIRGADPKAYINTYP